MPGGLAGIALTAAAALALCACATAPPATTRSAVVFSTRLDITVHHGDRAQAEAAIGEIVAHATDLERRFHPWREGPLTRLNAAIAAGELPREIDGDTQRLIELSRRVHDATGGQFNPALGKLFEMWGFHSDNPAAKAATQAEIDAYMADVPPIGSFVTHGGRLVEAHPRGQLDFGGILKGYSLDAARPMLEARGIRSALASYGSAILAVGAPPGRSHWHIGLRAAPGRPLLGTVRLDPGETLASAGVAERSYEDPEGGTVHHIFSQETGRPSSEVGFAAVVCGEGCGPSPSAVADALSTAMVVGAAADAGKVGRAMGAVDVLVVDRDGNVVTGGGPGSRFRLEE